MYYVIKRYHFQVGDDGTCAPFWLRAPHWNPVRHHTWAGARDAYIQARLTGYTGADLNIIFDGEE